MLIIIAGLCAAAATILDQSQEDLQNATSISYPPRMFNIFYYKKLLVYLFLILYVSRSGSHFPSKRD